MSEELLIKYLTEEENDAFAIQVVESLGSDGCTAEQLAEAAAQFTGMVLLAEMVGLWKQGLMKVGFVDGEIAWQLGEPPVSDES